MGTTLERKQFRSEEWKRKKYQGSNMRERVPNLLLSEQCKNYTNSNHIDQNLFFIS
jgi:hypothetical protein